MQLSTKISKYIILTAAFMCCIIPAFCQSIIDADAKPTVFAPGVISTQADEFAPTFTPDGKTVYFTGGNTFIFYSIFSDGKWAAPQLVSFSGTWKDMDPFLSPDGKRLFFASYRPYEGMPQDKPQKNDHIWYVDRLSVNSWSAPHHIEAPVNLAGVSNYSPSVSKFGSLCFSSPARDLNNKGKGYYFKWAGDHYAEPKMLSLNGAGNVRDPFIAPDERYIIFISGHDIYISYKNGDGWADGQKLGPQVNDGGANSSPCVSPDGKTLYYSSSNSKGILMVPVNISKNIN